jgi:AraC family transcriptional activator of tynA and feaB
MTHPDPHIATACRGAKAAPIISCWSTADVDPGRRLDYYAAATSAALIPLTITCTAQNFNARVERAQLGPLEVLRMNGSAHGVQRGLRDIAQSNTHHYYLMLNTTSRWSVSQGSDVLLAPGELVLVDSGQPYQLKLPAYQMVTLDLPSQWVSKWVRRPDLLVGRSLSKGSMSGVALASMLPMLTPAFAVDSPLPGSVLADQIGALLRSAEAELTGIPAALPTDGMGTVDVDAASDRNRVAARMLQSRLFAHVPVDEIATRAGFFSLDEMLAELHAISALT